MKKLGQVLRHAKISGVGKEKSLQDFLRVYRETPHYSTKVTPAMLMMGFSRSSGIPLSDGKIDWKAIEDLHKMAKANDQAAKARMQAESDARMRVKECQIKLKGLAKERAH